MKKYSSSSSYSVYEAVVASLMLLGIGIAFTYSTESIFLKTLSIILAIIAVVSIILYQRKRTFDIQFHEDKINIDYFLIKHKMEITYNDLLEITFISTHKSPNMNRIKFKKENKLHSIRFLSVAQSDEYIEFIKWLKSKNEKLELKVFPSDHIMDHKIQEVYGFKYRKFIKETL